jgi:hypothetical protein
VKTLIEQIMKMKNERNPMKGKILLAALWLVGCLIVSVIVVVSQDVSSGHRRADIHPSSKTSQGNGALNSLALALSSGKEAMYPSIEVHRVRRTLTKTSLILPLPEWIAILIVSLLMSRASVL